MSAPTTVPGPTTRADWYEAARQHYAQAAIAVLAEDSYSDEVATIVALGQLALALGHAADA
jgi:hypothetical protein